MAVTPGGPTGAAFKQRIDADIKTFGDVVKAAKLTFRNNMSQRCGRGIALRRLRPRARAATVGAEHFEFGGAVTLCGLWW